MNNPNFSTDNQTPYYNGIEDENIDFKRYLSLFINNWYWFAISIFIALSIAYVINRWSEEVYSVSSTLLINDGQLGSGGTGLSIFSGTDAFQNKQNLYNELGILKSFSLNYRVMQELPDFNVVCVGVGKRGIAESRMYKDSPFKVVCENLNNQRIGVQLTIKIISSEKFRLEVNGNSGFTRELSFGDRFNEEGFDFSIIKSNTSEFIFDPDASNNYYFYFVSPAVLANQYRSKLTITPIQEEATLVTLSTTGFVPEQEADYLNKLMDVYMQQGLEFKNQTADNTIEFIDAQVGSISDSLKIAENSLENFRLSNRLIDISREGSMIQNKLEAYENEQSSLILQKKYYGYLQDYLNSKNETGDIVSPGALGVSNGALERLVTELAAMQQQQKKLKVNIAADLPAINLIDINISDVKALLAENINSSIKNLDYALKESEDKISQVEAEIYKLPSTEIKLINIQRKFDLNNTVYTYLLEKRAEAGIARASEVSDNRIIDHADVFNSSRIKPKPRQNISVAFILGLIIPAVLILLVDLLNNKIIDKKDIERKTSVPIIGYISHNGLKNEIPVIENPGSTLSESFRSVRTSLKYFLKDIVCPVISVSSTITNEGKTFVSANLAAILAMSDKKVLLLGLDLRKPRIHKIFGIGNESGLSNYLIGEMTFEKVVIKTEVENLWYASAGPVPPNPAELIESNVMIKFIEQARKKFDYIIIDTPPVAIVTDALLVASFTDFYLFVVRQRYTRKNTIELIDELKKNESIKSLGIVVNDISVTGYYGYGLRYGYSTGYGYNYGYYNQYGKYGYSDSSKGYYKEDV